MCQASCQRGLLHRKSGNDELAKEDFEKAAKLGSQFAKSQVFFRIVYRFLFNYINLFAANRIKSVRSFVQSNVEESHGRFEMKPKLFVKIKCC